ncbi:hypothetical protein [Paenibacillus piri]|uniref:DUF4367 domain-containing protein n=1 Tax=Paenibacillus piri TaxID=2547395 RepID=A0A4R5KWG1_9BACL|nr:hypothetical protein [Paenibacillus piri]TDG00137.1 hypothetical protein E1757_00350 [Paenibacillus piri]
MSNEHKEEEQLLTDRAWAKLQDKLAKEPRNLRWAQMERAGAAARLAEQPFEPEPQRETHQPAVEAVQSAADLSGASVETAGQASVKGEKRFAGWFRKRRKLIGTAAAAAVLIIAIGTTTGNEALAAILHKFRMQEMTVVQKEDLQMILNGAFQDDKTRESINKFGTFTQKSGPQVDGPLTFEKANKLLNGKLTLPKSLDAKTVHIDAISQSNTITFQMNVDEVNKAMKRLGAKKLLPDSVSGKPITLEMGPSVHFNLNGAESNTKESNFWISQQPVPEITVDPSIPLTEAMAAVLDFPLLPENLKQSMQTANMLSGGSVPLPIIANKQMEQVKVNGITVLVKSQGSEQYPYFMANWVQNGMLYELGAGGKVMNQDILIAKIKELIGS